jgi:hypothetical protein
MCKEAYIVCKKAQVTFTKVNVRRKDFRRTRLCARGVATLNFNLRIDDKL